jgi:hypothetical protein
MNLLKLKMQRRAFLKNIAYAGLTTSFAGQLMSTKAFAQTVQARRFVFVYYPNGVSRGDSRWHQFNIGQLNDNSFGTSPLSELSSHFGKIVAFKNLNFNGAGGNSGHPEACETLFSGGQPGQSFDTFMGRSLGGRLRDNVHLGVWSSRARSKRHMPFSDANGQKIEVPDDPQIFYNNNLAAFEGNNNSSDDADVVMRQRVVESLHENLDVMQIQALNVKQNGKLLSHEESLNFYQSVLASNTSVDGISSPGISMTGEDATAHDVALAQTRNIAMAFQADVTSTATLQLMSAQDESLKINFPSIRQHMGEFGSGDKLFFNETKSHVASHDEKPTYTAQAHWYCQVINNLVDELSQRDDPKWGGKLIDHTVVLVMSEMGGGNHQQDNTGTFVVAGNNTGVQTGRGIDAGGRTSANLMLQVANTFALNQNRYGNSDGGIPGFSI